MTHFSVYACQQDIEWPPVSIHPYKFTASHDSPYAEQLRTRFRWLSFPAPLERQYAAFHVTHIRPRVRAFLSLLPLLLITSWINGGVDLTHPWETGLLIGSVTLFLIGGNWLVSSAKSARWYLPIVAPVAALMLLLSAYETPRSGVTDGAIEALEFIINIPLMTHLLLGLTFYRALTINICCLVMLFASATQVGVSMQALATLLTLPPLAVATATVIAYTAEHASRTLFLQEKLLEELASRDPLTGLHNRASFDSHLEMLWKQAQRAGDCVGLLLLDIDHFKLRNDTHGHQAGDECLRAVAQVIGQHARRPLDLAARYGGEEFAVLQFQTTPEQLKAVGEAIRAQVQALGIDNVGASHRVITISGGTAAAVPTAGRSMHALIKLADEALYLAKNEGRNCIRANEQELSSVTTGRFKKKPILRVVS